MWPLRGQIKSTSVVGKANYQTIFPNPLRGYLKKVLTNSEYFFDYFCLVLFWFYFWFYF